MPSDSERELFGGPLRYETGFTGHEYATLEPSVVSLSRSAPRLIARTGRLVWAADRRAVLAVGAAEIGQGVSRALGLLAVNAVLRILLGSGGGPAARLHTALPFLAVAGAIAAFGALLAALSTAATGRLEPKVERVATEQYLHAVINVELEAVEDGDFRRLIDLAEEGAVAARQMIGACTATINGLLAVISVGSVLTVLHPLLLPMLVVIVIPRGWGALRVAQHKYLSHMRWVEYLRASRVLSQLLTSRTAAAEVRVHDAGRYILGHYRQIAQTSEAEQTRLAQHNAAIELAAATVAGAATLATYSVLGGLILTGHVQLAAAGTAVLAIRSATASLTAAITNLNALQEHSLYVGDLDRLLDQAARRAIPHGGLDVPAHPEAITMEAVTFTYPDRPAPALENVSLTIRTGQVTALVGENGSGKSTLVKLLAGLYLPDHGQIRWDGIDLTHANRRQIFDRVSYLAQDFERWPFTAETNIRIGRHTAPTDDLEEAATYSSADKIIANLPKGMHTLLARVFRGGAELSGGQWQKIGLARTHFRDATIIVVDEPTSALDPAAEIECFDKIRTLAAPGRAIVLITHRMAAVQHADTIHVLHDGRLTETGTHEQLMARNGHYTTMYRMQADQYTNALDPTNSGEAAHN